MFRFLFILLLILLIFVAPLIGIAWLSLESRPSVTSSSTQFLDNAEEVDVLLKQLQSSIENREQPSSVTITESQLESLQGLFQRASTKLTGDAFIRQSGSVISTTYVLNVKGRTRYLNAHVWVTEGEGLPIQKVKIGRLPIPGGLAKTLLKHGLNFYTSSDIGNELLNTINRVSMSSGRAELALNPLGPVLNELRRIDTGSVSERDLELEKYTATFMRVLEDYEKNNGSRQRSLNDYIAVVFKAAAEQNEQTQAALINEAAILSLAIFAGHYRIGTFVGDVQIDVDKPSVPTHMPTLGSRVDLSQHFIISAALKILSKRGFSLAIGEFKELMDRGQGGSGYSFVDLAADRAGVKFADEATDPDKAWLVQRRVAAGVAEGAYFPSVEGLIEGLNKRAFTQRFKEVDSPEYIKEIDRIKGRIRRLQLYAI